MVWNEGTEGEIEYKGAWVDGKAHGFGTLKSKPGGYLYQGQFIANRRHGKGKQTWVNFEVRSYQGDWLDDMPEGFGILTSKSEEIYGG